MQSTLMTWNSRFCRDAGVFIQSRAGALIALFNTPLCNMESAASHYVCVCCREEKLYWCLIAFAAIRLHLGLFVYLPSNWRRLNWNCSSSAAHVGAAQINSGSRSALFSIQMEHKHFIKTITLITKHVTCYYDLLSIIILGAFETMQI
jgi:hypothetical protein